MEGRPPTRFLERQTRSRLFTFRNKVVSTSLMPRDEAVCSVTRIGHRFAISDVGLHQVVADV